MELRAECERCQVSLSDDGPAYLCTNECTFCATCYRRLNYVCPNCSGELVRRPRPGPSQRPAARSSSPVAEGRLTVRTATRSDVDVLAPLFDAYRQFYEQPSDPSAAREFLEARLSRGESVALVAENAGVAVGFAQLYPLFSSISLGPVYLLNDLFVEPKARRHGVGSRLLEAARAQGELARAHYLELSTAVDNPAQRLYEARGWTLDREFLHYDLPLPRQSGARSTGEGTAPGRRGPSPPLERTLGRPSSGRPRGARGRRAGRP